MNLHQSSTQDCPHFIEAEGDRWAGTYCKLPAEHKGPHSPHFPLAHPADLRRCQGCGGLLDCSCPEDRP